MYWAPFSRNEVCRLIISLPTLSIVSFLFSIAFASHLASLTFSLMNSRCSLSLTFSRTSCAYSLLILTSGKVELFKSTVQPSSVSETCKSGSLIGAPRLSNFNPGFGSKALIFLKIIAISSSEQPLRLFKRSNFPVAIKCRFSKTIAKFSQYCSLSLAWRIRHSLRLRANRPAGSIS